MAKLDKKVEELKERLENMRRLKNQANARARDAEKASTRTGLYLERAQNAETKALELRQEYDALHELYDDARAIAVAAAHGCSESDILIADIVSRDERGRFGKVDHGTRVLIMGELARMTPPSAVPLNILCKLLESWRPQKPFASRRMPLSRMSVWSLASWARCWRLCKLQMRPRSSHLDGMSRRSYR